MRAYTIYICILLSGFLSCNKGPRMNYELSMVDIPKTDGSYEIEFLRNGQIEKKKFGYYTNGYPINEKFIIEIHVLEINIKEE